MRIIFTKGIYGEIDEGIIYLISAENRVSTNQKYNYEGLKMIEDTYKIKLISIIENENNIIRSYNDYSFVSIENNHIRDVTSELYGLDDIFVDLYDLITNIIFPDIDEYYFLIKKVPPYIKTEGIQQSYFMSKEIFQKIYYKDFIFNKLNDNEKFKLLYLFDIFSLIDDVKHSFFSIEYPFIHACEQFIYLHNNIYKLFKREDRITQFENMFMGIDATIANSNFMTSVIRICSTLDLVTKLAYELVNVPHNFDKIYKFKSGKLYFSDIKQLEPKLCKQDNYNSSLIKNRKNYESLLYLRNNIIHNNFISSQPCITYGYKTHEVNFNEINYAMIYLWDVGDDGKATRWGNRYKFYSQNRCLQEYLYSEILRFYSDFKGMMKLLHEYLDNIKY